MEVPITRRTALFYEYVTENLVERRAPFREEHIGLVREWTAAGRMVMAGALGSPPHGGLLVFAAEDPTDAEEFASIDPYVRNGLVTSWRVEPWNVVS